MQRGRKLWILLISNKDEIVGFYNDDEIKDYQIHFAGSISKSKITYTGFTYYGDGILLFEHERTIPLKYLLSAELFDNWSSVEETILLELVGDYIFTLRKEFTTDGALKNTATIHRSNLNFDVNNLELQPRMLKAFQHLAYLANEYREQQRLNSGDAF